MSRGESFRPENIQEILAPGAGGIVIPGHDAYFEALTGSPESRFLSTEPTTEEVHQREEQFALKVVFAGAIMAARNPGIVTLLSDVDQTITEDEEATIIRPAFPFALNALHKVLGDRLECGLLTTLPRESHPERLPMYFKGVTAKVNPEFAISSRAAESADPGIQEALDRQDFTTVEEIVDPEIIKGTKEGTIKDFWFRSKLVVLQRLVLEHPERSFILVDDLIWAGVIKEDHPRAMGVWVGEEMQNDLPRVGKDRLRNH